jgi:hypothetical protein
MELAPEISVDHDVNFMIAGILGGDPLVNSG